jgi:aspergillopepsin I
MLPNSQNLRIIFITTRKILPLMDKETDSYYLVTLFTVNHHYTGGGTWTFGTIDSTQYTNSISYSTAYHPDYDNLWTINATSYSVGSFTPTTLSLPIILDTGSYVTVLPASVCAAYWAKVTGAELYNGNYVFPCTSTLPDFHIKITGGYNATIHGAYWNLGSISGGVPSSAYCYGGLQPTTGLSVFGATFFESLFVVFDYGGSRIGLATKTLP